MYINTESIVCTKEKRVCPCVFLAPRTRLIPTRRISDMKTVVWKNKAIEREKLLRLFMEKASEMPEPNDDIVGFDYEWQEYCTEIRELEVALVEAGQ